MHINDVEERRFIQDKIEGRDAEIHFTDEGKRAILNRIIEAEQFKGFLGKKYVGTKRFGLDGREEMVPALYSAITPADADGVKDVVNGLPQRERLKVLATDTTKKIKAICHGFAGGKGKTAR